MGIGNIGEWGSAHAHHAATHAHVDVAQRRERTHGREGEHRARGAEPGEARVERVAQLAVAQLDRAVMPRELALAGAPPVGARATPGASVRTVCWCNAF